MQKKIILILAALFLAGLTSAFATPTLVLTDGTNTATVVAGSDGTAMYNGSLGNWLINVTVGLTKPTLGSVLYPEMDVNTLLVSNSSTSASTLYVLWSDSGFGPLTNTDFVASAGGTLANANGTSVTFNTFYDQNNSIATKLSDLANFTQMTTETFTGGGAFSGTQVSPHYNLNASYSLLEEVVVYHPGGSRSFLNSSGDFHLQAPIPEPSTLLLFGSGLVALGLMGFKRKK
jgi:hypothetical protein